MVPGEKRREPTFEDVYASLFPVVFRVAYRITGSAERAEEICQEAFIRYMERARPLPDVEQARFWLLRVVKNLSLNLEKRKGRERRAYEKAGRIARASAESGEEELMRRETRNAVQRALLRLPHGLRTVLVLKEYSGLHYRQIGRILGISEGNVKIRVFRAREKLAKELRVEGLEREQE